MPHKYIYYTHESNPASNITKDVIQNGDDCFQGSFGELSNSRKVG